VSTATATGNLASIIKDLSRAQDPKTLQDISTQVQGVFGDATWEFHPDGTFELTPLPRARGMSAPLTGRYEDRAGVIELHSGGPSKGFTLDGTIHPARGVYSLEAIYAARYGPEVALIRQTLKRQRSVRTSGSPRIPDTFDLQMAVQQGDADLPPRPASLRILYPMAGSSAPIAVDMETPQSSLAGDFFWMASGEASGDRISFAKGSVVDDFGATPKWTSTEGSAVTDGIVDLSDHFWTSSNSRAQSFTKAWFQIERGKLTFSIRGDLITGQVHAVGVERDRKERVAFQATFTGKRHNSQPTSTATELAKPTPLQQANTGARFRIEVQGETESGSFNRREGWLFIVPQGDDQASLNLLTTTMPLGPGSIHWDNAIVPYPKPGRPVAITLEPRDNVQAAHSGVEWFTSAEAGHPFAHVVPNKANLTLTIGPDRTVTGEISGAGTVVTDQPRPGTYHATFHGALETSALRERFERELEENGAAGEWSFTDSRGQRLGSLSLERTREGLHGTVATTAGTIEVYGKEKDDLLTLRLKNRTGELILRRGAIGRDLLFGLNEERVPGAASVIVATRTRLPMTRIRTEEGTEDDADELRWLGIRLSSNECEPAITALEGAFGIYQRLLDESEKHDKSIAGQAKQRLVYGSIEEVGVFLTSCDFQLGDPGLLIDHLGKRLGALHARHLSDLAVPAATFENPAKSVVDDLNSTADQMRVLVERFEDIQKNSFRFPAAPPDQDAFQAAQQVCIQELRSILSNLTAASIAVTHLVHEVRDGYRSSAGAQAEVYRRLFDLRAAAESSYQRIAVQGREILSREPELLAARDRYWSLTRDFSHMDPVAATVSEKSLFDSLKGSPRLGPFWGTFFVGQAIAGVLLEGLEPILDSKANLMAIAVSPTSSTRIERDLVAVAHDLERDPERWRQRLATDPGKLQLADRLSVIFGDLALLLYEAGRMDDDASGDKDKEAYRSQDLQNLSVREQEEALVVSEAGRSRALMDLLAARSPGRGFRGASLVDEGQGRLKSPKAAGQLDIAQLREEVRLSGSTTIEYLVTPHKLLIWVIRPSGMINSFSADIEEDQLKQLASELSVRMEAGIGSGATDLEAEGFLKKLYKYLIAPIPSHLLPTDPDDVLTIIPHGVLFSIPFAALEDEQGTPWVTRHALVLETSIGVLRFARENRLQRSGNKPSGMLALVNPSPMPFADRQRPFERYGALSALESQFPLIAAFYPGNKQSVLTGPAANKAALQASSTDAEFIYLATHAKFVDANDSYIALAASKQAEDGYLNVLDAAQLDLHAQLVVLWACETGRGESSPDGVEGLSRAFTIAGSRGLLLSLWTVPEQESFYLMYAFHAFWRREKMTVARALRRAQLEYIKGRSGRPDLWAAFTFYGEDG